MGGQPVELDRHGGSAWAPSRDDARLIVQIRQRDLRAFEALYHSYHPRLSRFLGNLVHRPQLVEEVLNDTMMVVWEKPESFRGEAKLSTWIYAIAYRKAMKALRRQDEPIDDVDSENRVSDAAGADELYRRRQVQTLLRDAIRQLSPDHRAVVELAYFHEMSCLEIAEIMNSPVNTVKTRMFHARRLLKPLLAGDAADWI